MIDQICSTGSSANIMNYLFLFFIFILCGYRITKLLGNKVHSHFT